MLVVDFDIKKHRKMLFRLGFLVLFLGVLSCERDNEPVTPKAAVVDVKALRFGHDMHEDSAQHLAALMFAEMVAEKTKGAVTISVYPNQQLGNDRKMIELAQNGSLDFILPPTAKISHILPAFQMFDLPYVFNSREQVYRALDGSFGRDLLSSMNTQQLVGLSFWESGFKQLTSNKRFTTIAELRGQKFRIMESPLLGGQFKLWGAQSRVIDFASTFAALEEGAVDGQENPLASIVGMRFHQEQKYIAMSNHGYLAQVLAISQNTYNHLSGSEIKAITEAAQEATLSQRKMAKEQNELYFEEIQKSSIDVINLSPELKAFMKLQSRRLLEKYRPTFGTSRVEQLLQILEDERKFSDNQLVIALDADLQGNSAQSGLAIRRGIELAIDEINAAGGVLGKQFVLTARDNSMIPARGLDNLKKFNSIPNLLAVFGGISSPVVLGELEYIHQHQLLFLNPWAAATPIINNGYKTSYIFRVSVRDEYAAGFLVDEALRSTDRIGLLLVNNPWGRSNHKAITAYLEEKNLRPTDIQWFEWGTKTFKEVVASFSESKTESVIYVGNPVEGAAFIKALAELSDAPAVVSHWGVTGSNFYQLVPDELNSVDFKVLQTYSFIGNQSKTARRLASRYHQKYLTLTEEDIVSPVGTAHAYDLTHLLAIALKQAGTTNRESVRDAMENIPMYRGVIKSYQYPFSATDHDALDASNFIFARYQNGALYPQVLNE